MAWRLGRRDVKDQGYAETVDHAIKDAITITGSLEDAQALTTEQYLMQTWPYSGADIIRLVTKVVMDEKREGSRELHRRRHPLDCAC